MDLNEFIEILKNDKREYKERGKNCDVEIVLEQAKVKIIDKEIYEIEQMLKVANQKRNSYFRQMESLISEKENCEVEINEIGIVLFYANIHKD